MIKISNKSLKALPLALLAFGVLPILLIPIGQMTWFQSDGFTNQSKAAMITAGWPFFFDAYNLQKIEFILLLPVAFIIYALAKGKKAYHGLWALFLVIGFILKATNMDYLNMFILAAMGGLAALNAWAYLEATGDTLDDWLRYKYGEKRLVPSQAYLGPDFSSFNGQIYDKKGVDGSQGNGNAVPITYMAMIPKRNFNHVIGMTEFKDKLLKAGNEVLSGSGSKRNGILLTGEPGNGKTTMAESLAGALKLPIISVAFGSFASSWVGQTTERVMKVFDDAERQAPCLLFIDEIEALLIDRSRVSNADSEGPKTVSAILKRLEDIRKHKVVLVAASNFLERLDPAAIREGRFDYKIEVPPPDFEARKFLLEAGLKSVASLVDSTGLERAAKRWEGFSVARLRAVASEVMDKLNDQKISKIGFDELSDALRSLNATKGDKLPESTLSIEQLILEPDMRSRMRKLANRMINIDEIEEMGGSVPAGVLFHGPAGTGKTIAAMALAKESKWAFLKTSGHDLLHSPDKMDDLMKRAKDIRPCVIFIDEADDVLADRRSSMISKDVTNKLLSIMDGAGGRTKDILFVAATNAPDLIDEAMLRGGRFTEKIAFDVPGDEALHEYVSKWIATTKAKLADDFTAYAVVEALSGQSLANVGEILQSAVNEAISTGENKNFRVNLSHLNEALKLVRGD
ncbi:MAG: AAA family ATPase [Betaproteobacteria bacterium]